MSCAETAAMNDEITAVPISEVLSARRHADRCLLSWTSSKEMAASDGAFTQHLLDLHWLHPLPPSLLYTADRQFPFPQLVALHWDKGSNANSAVYRCGLWAHGGFGVMGRGSLSVSWNAHSLSPEIDSLMP